MRERSWLYQAFVYFGFCALGSTLDCWFRNLGLDFGPWLLNPRLVVEAFAHTLNKNHQVLITFHERLQKLILCSAVSARLSDRSRALARLSPVGRARGRDWLCLGSGFGIYVGLGD